MKYQCKNLDLHFSVVFLRSWTVPAVSHITRSDQNDGPSYVTGPATPRSGPSFLGKPTFQSQNTQSTDKPSEK